MEKTEIVDDMDHGFFQEQAYMVHADELEGKTTPSNCSRVSFVLF